MGKKIRRWKSYAKETLKGSYSLPMLGMLALTALNAVASQLTGMLFRGSTVLSLIMGQVFLFVLCLIIGVFSAGLAYMYLNMARGRAYSIQDMLYFFKNHPDRVIVAGLVLGLIDLVVSLPSFYMTYFVQAGPTLEEQMTWITKLAGTMVLASVLRALFTMPFVLAYYLMADELELGGIEALKRSARMMKGNYGKYLLMEISFIPLLILSVFTLYIALLWIVPYMEMSAVMFFRDLNGEFTPEMPDYVTPYSLSQAKAAARKAVDERMAEGYCPGSWRELTQAPQAGGQTGAELSGSGEEWKDNPKEAPKRQEPPKDDFNAEA